MTEYTPSPLGKRIAGLRKARGLSQQGLADQLPDHMSRITISSVESGRKPQLYAEDLAHVAKALYVSVFDLMPEFGLHLADEAYKSGYNQAIADMRSWAELKQGDR